VTNLERHYRRLLACYPRDHRERHGEEMLGVLLASGQPGWRETANLLWNAFRLHLRRVVAADGGIDPRDVLSIVGLLGPVALLAGATTGLHEAAWFIKAGSLWDMPLWSQFKEAPVFLVWLIVGVCALAGRHRVAAVGAWLATAGFVALAVFSPWWPPVDPGWVLLGALTAVALTWFPPRRLVGGKAVLILSGTVIAAVALGVFGYGDERVEWARLAVLAVGAVAASAPATRVGRRAALVLLVPVMTAVLGHYLWAERIPDSARTAIFYCVPVVVLLALGGLPRRIRRRRKNSAT
jgi:hypothetical protein